MLIRLSARRKRLYLLLSVLILTGFLLFEYFKLSKPKIIRSKFSNHLVIAKRDVVIETTENPLNISTVTTKTTTKRTKRPKKTTKSTTQAPLRLPQLMHRLDFAILMEGMRGEVMIEIGVRDGEYTSQILTRWPSLKVYFGIDTWKSQNSDDAVRQYVKTKSLLKSFRDKVFLIKDNSKHAIKNFDKDTIDFIYIDGRRHDYCAVMDDLTLYYPLLRCDGIMAGNYFLTVFEQSKFGTDQFDECENKTVVLKSGGGPKGAVLDFTRQNGITDVLSTIEKVPSFYFMKHCPER